jgi:hypothetical protein
MDALILRTRCDIREWKRTIALISGGYMHVRTNGVDRSSEQASIFRRMIHENQALVDRYDPEGLVADDDIELGDIPAHQAQSLWKERPVSYAPDTEGRAVQLRLFDSDSAAATDAAMFQGRRSGRIGDEGWSIKPAAITTD